MALNIIPLKDGNGPLETVTVDRHLYLTEDGARVVPEGHPAGRWLWAAPGSEVSRADALRLGAVEAEPDPRPEPAVGTKAAPKPPDKQRTKPADKAANVPDLREQATALGVQVDNRWGLERLQQEIDSASETV